ncbi:MAG: hypothetical protein QOJ62_2328 [Actinomycetota bacterium]|jgi:hypothetical protein|nr:hypothetical protein [Actinomycetota bacterium]
MTDPNDERTELDLRVQDPTALEEIDLYSELMIVAAASKDALSLDQIDRALGLSPAGQLADSTNVIH